MEISKILNNNVVTIKDQGKEKVVMGKGIAFNKKRGQTIDTAKIEKIFSLNDEENNQKFQQLINEVPIEHIRVAEQIISYAKSNLKKPLDDHIYVALTDHLTFAIKRAKSNVYFSNPLLFEIKRMHLKEYEVGVKATEMINEQFDVNLNDDEAGFLALHLINASSKNQMSDTMNTLELVHEIIKIVKYHFNIDFDTSDISYSRLMTHLRYFSERVLQGNMINQGEDQLFNLIREQYSNSFECVLKIKAYIQKKYKYTVSKQELLYLTLHVRRVVSRVKPELVND